MFFTPPRHTSEIIVTHLTTPNMRLLDKRSASGSTGCTMRPHNCPMSAVSTDRLGSFLKVDFDPSVAASLKNRQQAPYANGQRTHHSSPKPLSRRARSSWVKNIGDHTQSERLQRLSRKRAQDASRQERDGAQKGHHKNGIYIQARNIRKFEAASVLISLSPKVAITRILIQAPLKTKWPPPRPSPQIFCHRWWPSPMSLAKSSSLPFIQWYFSSVSLPVSGFM